jgi:hypothetical protein
VSVGVPLVIVTFSEALSVKVTTAPDFKEPEPETSPLPLAATAVIDGARVSTAILKEEEARLLLPAASWKAPLAMLTVAAVVLLAEATKLAE